MIMRYLSYRISAALLLNLAALCTTADAAQWTNAAGGDIGNNANWSGNQIPSTGDSGVFDLSTAGYEVTALQDISLSRFLVGTDKVTLNLGTNSVLLLSEQPTKGLSVAFENGNHALLRLTSGTVVTESMFVASTDGTNGTKGVLEISGPTAILQLLGNNLAENQIGGTGDDSGELIVSNGGKLIGSSTDLLFGRNGGVGKLIVTDANSYVEIAELYVGLLGHGEAIIKDGGEVVVNAFMSIANQDINPTGSVLVSTDGMLRVDGRLAIGRAGFGLLTIEDGGVVTSKATLPVSGTLGQDENAQGEVHVTGVGSMWLQDGALDVGRAGSGTLSVDDQGFVSAQDIRLSRFSTATSDVSVDGANSKLEALDRLVIGGDFAAPGGIAQLTVKNSGYVSAGSQLQLWTTGTVDVAAGGTIEIGAVDLTASSAIVIGNGGLLNGSGAIVGDVIVDEGGVVSPGFSPGTLSIDGDLTLLAGSVLELEIRDPASSMSDRLEVNGSFTPGGELVVRFLEGYVPLSDSTTFPLITATALGNSLFTNVRFENINPALVPASWSDGRFAIQVIPEPSTALLAALMAVALSVMPRIALRRFC